VADRPQAALGRVFVPLLWDTTKGCGAAHKQDLTGTLSLPRLS